jgi:formiminotetrahydrofolate cyclodeaminase
MAGALVVMVARLTTGRKPYAQMQNRVDEIIVEANGLRVQLRRLVDEDAAAYARVTAASKEGKDDALRGAVQTPLAIVRAVARLIALAQEIARIGNPNARADAHVGEALARAALAGAVENVRVNVAALSRPATGQTLLDEAERLASEVREG